MARSFTARDLVQLPILTAEDAYALASQLTTHAAVERVPASLGELVDQLASARDALGAQLAARRANTGSDPRAALEADRAVDAAWGMFRGWLGAWHELGARGPRASEVAELHAFLFGEGLTFLALKYEAEWSATETRIQALKTRRNAELVRELGGGPLLEALLDAHAKYGEALEITRPAATPTDTKVRDALDVVLDSIREYVLGVAGTVRRDRPVTQERADRLLRPLAEWQTTARAPAAPIPAPPSPADPTPTA